MENDQRVIDAVEMLLNAVNGSQDLGKKMFHEISRGHRTLQASFWRLILEVMDIYGDTELKDLRNEGAVAACRKISDFVKDPDNEIYISYI